MTRSRLIPAHIDSLADYIEEAFQRYADRPAYNALGQTLTYAEIDSLSKKFAVWLLSEGGLKAGDRIAIQLPNLIQNPIAVYGALRAGLVVVNTNPLYTPREMSHQFSDSGAKALVILHDFVDKFEQIKSQTNITTVVVTSAAQLISQQKCDAQYPCFIDVFEQAAEQPLPARPSLSVLDTCILQYTGGTTGVSKGAELSHQNVLANSLQTLDRLGATFVEGKEIIVCPLPLYHIYAFTVCMMTFFAKGGLTVLIPNPRDLDAFVAGIKPFSFTAFAGLNTLFVGLSNHPEFKQLDFSALKLTMSGGTALTSAAASLWEKTTGCTVTEGYGLSETSPVVAFNQPQMEHLGTVGLPVLDTQIMYLDEADNPVPTGEPGQLAVKGPQVMKGYWQRPQETAKVTTADGFFKTGDIAMELPDGCIKIVDRLKDLIIVSGFNVYPNEVEDVLTQHPAVGEAAVVGKADEKTQERVCAYITVTSEVQNEVLIEHCKHLLTAYKVPKEIHIVDELPKSTVGKILRRELK